MSGCGRSRPRAAVSTAPPPGSGRPRPGLVTCDVLRPLGDLSACTIHFVPNGKRRREAGGGCCRAGRCRFASQTRAKASREKVPPGVCWREHIGVTGLHGVCSCPRLVCPKWRRFFLCWTWLIDWRLPGDPTGFRWTSQRGCRSPRDHGTAHVTDLRSLKC